MVLHKRINQQSIQSENKIVNPILSSILYISSAALVIFGDDSVHHLGISMAATFLTHPAGSAFITLAATATTIAFAWLITAITTVFAAIFTITVAVFAIFTVSVTILALFAILFAVCAACFRGDCACIIHRCRAWIGGRVNSYCHECKYYYTC
jgi:hypothetical protein